MSEFSEAIPMYDPAIALDRNLGFMSADEQRKVAEATVSIAGVGGDGALVAVELARMGFNHFRLADPDPFEMENLNRQATSTMDTIGVNKAEAVGNYLKRINPDATIELFTDGVQEDNVEEFVKGSTLVIDETEFTLHAIGIRIARQAREHNIPVLTGLNIGFAGMVTTYAPDGKPLEEQLGFKTTQSIDEIAAKEVPLSRWLPYVPKYGDMNVLKKVASGEKSAPSIAPGVAQAAAMVTNEAFLNVVGTDNNRPLPIYAPKVMVIDVMARKLDIMQYHWTTHYRTLAKMALANARHQNPVADY